MALNLNAEVEIFFFKFALVQGVPNENRDFFAVQRFFQVVIRAELRGLHRRFNGPMPGHHDHHHVWKLLSHALQHFQAVEIRHPDVKKHQIRRILSNDVQSVHAAFRRGDLIPFVFQKFAQRFQDARLIIHKTDRVRHGDPSMRVNVSK